MKNFIAANIRNYRLNLINVPTRNVIGRVFILVQKFTLYNINIPIENNNEDIRNFMDTVYIQSSINFLVSIYIYNNGMKIYSNINEIYSLCYLKNFQGFNYNASMESYL